MRQNEPYSCHSSVEREREGFHLVPGDQPLPHTYIYNQSVIRTQWGYSLIGQCTKLT